MQPIDFDHSRRLIGEALTAACEFLARRRHPGHGSSCGLSRSCSARRRRRLRTSRYGIADTGRGEREKGRHRGEGDDEEREQREMRHHQEDEQRSEKVMLGVSFDREQPTAPLADRCSGAGTNVAARSMRSGCTRLPLPARRRDIACHMFEADAGHAIDSPNGLRTASGVHRHPPRSAATTCPHLEFRTLAPFPLAVRRSRLRRGGRCSRTLVSVRRTRRMGP